MDQRLPDFLPANCLSLYRTAIQYWTGQSARGVQASSYPCPHIFLPRYTGRGMLNNYPVRLNVTRNTLIGGQNGSSQNPHDWSAPSGLPSAIYYTGTLAITDSRAFSPVYQGRSTVGTELRTEFPPKKEKKIFAHESGANQTSDRCQIRVNIVVSYLAGAQPRKRRRDLRIAYKPRSGEVIPAIFPSAQ
ncbi:hypothetical protein BGX38DRAFT_689648 [Terfezia claveryi]|nr:hypothetical protein BGX38DRAFT_689648 [Terfezia claveryi]